MRELRSSVKTVSPLVTGAVAIFAILAFLTTILYMPASELLPAQVTPGPVEPGYSPMRSKSIMDFYGSLASGVADMVYHTGDLKQVVSTPARENLPGEDKSYIWYSVFLTLALVFAAIAISAIGRLDSEEVTVIPAKK